MEWPRSSAARSKLCCIGVMGRSGEISSADYSTRPRRRIEGVGRIPVARSVGGSCMTSPVVLNELLPAPGVVALDKSFEKSRQPMASLERLSQGYAWAEGPVWFGDARCL